MVDDKTKERFRKWGEAANILAKNPTAKVRCPECSIGYLIVKDVLVESQNKLDRYMQCDNCSSYNVITMEIPENYPNSGYRNSLSDQDDIN
jgi:DNA-directed RNA polymerase subunit RPC12/RpoP